MKALRMIGTLVAALAAAAILAGAARAVPDPNGPWTLSSELPSIRSVPDDGFQWGDAAFGAGAALGLVLLGVVAVMTIRHRSRVALP